MQLPVVVRLGKIMCAHDKWEALGKVAKIIGFDEKDTREKFVELLKDKNSDLSRLCAITITPPSVAETGRIDKEIIDLLPDTMRGVCVCAAGYDMVDHKLLAERRMQVSHSPNIVSAATADAHVLLLLGALRNFGQGLTYLRAGKWPGKLAAGCDYGRDPEGKTVGILGMGRIGREIVKRLRPFGFARFVYHNRNKLPEEFEVGCEYVSFEELLSTSDVISVSVPLTEETKGIINADAISRMKDGVVIANTARGPVIDEMALLEGLRSGKIRSAGLDVFEREPEVPKELREMPNVLCTPHIGAFTVETINKMEECVIDNVFSLIYEGKVITPIPEMQDLTWINEVPPTLSQYD